MLGKPLGLGGQGGLGVVAHAVGFYVGFIVHIEAQGVAELVELPLLRIVAGADGVDVGQFHQLEVFQNVLPGGVVARVGVVLVQVDALELDGLAVDQEGLHRTGCPVIPDLIGNLCNLQAAEAHVETGVLSVDAEQEGIQVGGLGAPQARGGDAVRYGDDVTGELEEGVGHRLSVPVQEFVEDLGGGLCAHLELEQAGLEVRRGGGDDLEVEAAQGLFTGEVDIPLLAGKAPEVLALQPGALGVAVHAQQNLVLSGLERVRDAEAGQVLGVFAVAYLLSVHVHIGAALGAGQVEEDLAALPTVRNGEGAVVQGGGNGLGQHARNGILRAEVVRDVHVDGRAPALGFPVAGDLDLVPVQGAEQVLFHHPVVFKVLEVPGSVQALVVLTLAEAFGEGIGPVLVIDDFRAPGLCVDGGGLDVLPVGEDGGGQYKKDAIHWGCR